MTIKELKRQLLELAYDDLFGVLTRNGLKQKIKQIKKPFNALFIDIDNMKQLNADRGYDLVNDLIKDAISNFKFRQDDIIGRYFSGDELLIICEFPKKLAKRLKTQFKERGLTFKHKYFYGLTNIEDISQGLK